MKKQFTKKEIEKRFKALYPNGIIRFDKPAFYSKDGNITIDIRYNDLYELALKLNLASTSEVSEMKRLAGYRNY